jgi:hypothetical protein
MHPTPNHIAACIEAEMDKINAPVAVFEAIRAGIKRACDEYDQTPQSKARW